ncbi:MAG TPA: alpha/beta hydrolase, partial [Longimicrobiales bacterium]|nr:alpha/beta hydrolase [Longimicrobiales bacterium]
ASVEQDLHALLQAAGESAPYVMVGASMGGLYVRSYQADYPEEVVGLVLVDPSSEDRLFTMYEGSPVLIAMLTTSQLRATLPRLPVAVLRRAPQTGAPFDLLPPASYELRVKLDRRLIASVPDTLTPEFIAEFRETERARLARLLQLRARNAAPLGDRPTVVLSRGIESGAELQATHAALAGLSTNARHTVVPGAGHEIHLFEPIAVVQAIADVASAVRNKTRLPPR